jgi:hypothetical protein
MTPWGGNLGVEIVRQRSCVPVSACHNLSVISYATKTEQFLVILDAPACCRRNPLKLSWFRIWHSTPTSELLLYKARLIKCQCSFATRARHASLRILQSAIIVMPGYISRSLKVSHSSGTKVIELCLEIVDSIPKPLQGIWVHSKGTLGFRRWFHHYPSHFLLSQCLPFLVSSRKVVES